jgi:hypothetical protein
LITLEEDVVAERPLGAEGAVVHVPPPPLPAAALTEKLLIAKPWPPVQISKPYSTSISHHELSRLPLATASAKNGRRFRLADVTGLVATYEMIFHDVWFPVHTA